ncbi:amino acid ABC transporter permease [Actinomadura formosensis]|uniref:amino acid ABC transporter permease n=1 Tax=Actinomadura formosensis TaxID=60706 RepID=UPI00082FF2EF|nr:amino acid ABC transporter permease [Actinomadura formosensis]
MQWLSDFIDTAPVFLDALWLTLQLALWSIVLAAVLGAVLAYCRLSRLGPVRALAAGYVSLIRGTPLVTQLFIIYFGLASIVTIEAFWAGVIGLSVHNAAYVAEIYRSGIQSVPTGQVEAGRSLGMSSWKTMRLVIAPQALRTVLPSLGNQFIIAVKDTSVAAFITVAELFRTAQIVAAEKFRPLEFYVIVGIYYLVIVLLLSGGVRMLERRMGRYGV